MSLTTLVSVKNHLGIASTDTSQDARLLQFMGQASESIRSYCAQNLGWVISSITAGEAALLNVPAHGLQDGQTVNINRSQCTPSIDGGQIITVVDDDNFTVPVAVETGSAANIANAGYFARTYTEFYWGRNRREMILRQRPVQAVSALYYDPTGYFGQGNPSFDPTSTLLTDGIDYTLRIDNNDAVEKSKAGIVLKINGYWPGSTDRVRGLLGANPVDAPGNIKVIYTGGWSVLPAPIVYATNMLAGVMKRSATKGGVLQSETVDYYTYTLASANKGTELGDIKQSLSRYKAMQI
jgi:hypothetical protein